MTTHDKARENRLRRMAHRQGLALRKSRRRDRHAPDYGELWLLRKRAWGGAGWELVAHPEDTDDAWVGPFYSLDEVESHLTGEAEEVAKQKGTASDPERLAELLVALLDMSAEDQRAAFAKLPREDRDKLARMRPLGWLLGDAGMWRRT